MRKGYAFVYFLLLTYLLCGITALILLNSQLHQMPQGLGTYAGATQAAANRAASNVFYLAEAAPIGAKTAFTQLYTDQRATFTPRTGTATATSSLSCGSYAYQLWNTKDTRCLLGDQKKRLLTTIQSRIAEEITSLALQEGINVAYTATLTPQNKALQLDLAGKPLTEEIVNADYGSAPATTISTGQLALPYSDTHVNGRVISSCFSQLRKMTVNGKTQRLPHRGADFAIINVVAADNGLVTHVTNDPGPDGDKVAIYIEHSPTFMTVYRHLDADSVKRALHISAITDQMRYKNYWDAHQLVITKGQSLGMTDPAYHSGRHLHFETYVKDVPSGAITIEGPTLVKGWIAVDPLCFLDPAWVKTPGIIDAGPNDNSCDRLNNNPLAYCKGITLTPGSTTPSMQRAPKLPPGSTADQSKLDETSKNKNNWDGHVQMASATYGVPEAAILAVITREAQGRSDDVGASDDVGIMQITPIGANEIKQQCSAFASAQYTQCDCTRLRGRTTGTCACDPNNDFRLNVDQAIPAGACYLHLLMSKFELARRPMTEQLKFVFASYNMGYSRVLKAVTDVGSDPTWERVRDQMRKNGVQKSTLQRVDDYVQETYAFYLAWGGTPLTGTRGSSAIVEKYGTYTYDPSLTVTIPDYLSPFLDVVKEATDAIDACAKQDDPGACLSTKLGGDGPCSNDDAERYFVSLYEAIKDCSENGQTHCACKGVQQQSRTLGDGTWTFTVNPLSGDATLQKDGTFYSSLHFDGMLKPTLRVGAGEGTVPKAFAIIYEQKGKKNELRIEYTDTGGVKQTMNAGFLFEKGSDFSRVIFRENKEATELCAPVKRQYTFCKAIPGKEPIRYALTVNDPTLPKAVTKPKYDATTNKITFTPSSSKDIAYYNIYTDPSLSSPAFQVRSKSFTGEPGNTYFIQPVDKAGNKGSVKSIATPPPPMP